MSQSAFDVLCGQHYIPIGSAQETRILFPVLVQRHSILWIQLPFSSLQLTERSLRNMASYVVLQHHFVSPSHCFLYRLILPNPHNPTVVWVKYLIPAVSSHLLLGFLYPPPLLHTPDYSWASFRSATSQVSKIFFYWRSLMVYNVNVILSRKQKQLHLCVLWWKRWCIDDAMFVCPV